MDDVKLKPCPMCGGTPLLLIMRQYAECSVHVECTNCGLQSFGVIFAGRTATPERRRQLPQLRAARLQVMTAWNERIAEDGSA